MAVRNPTSWSNADTKNPTAFTDADTKAPTPWREGVIANPGILPLFSNDLRTLMSNDGRLLETAGYYPTDENPTAWTPIG